MSVRPYRDIYRRKSRQIRVGDVLVGGDGQDYLHGGSGNDALHGGLGDDTLIGRGVTNLLYGGNGQDNIEAIGIMPSGENCNIANAPPTRPPRRGAATTPRAKPKRPRFRRGRC